jgi:hypothetical protein
MPFIRLPFLATSLLASGLGLFKGIYELLKRMGYPIQFQFHLSDFVDYGHPELIDQVPGGRGVYVPQALRKPLKEKMGLFQKAMDLISGDCTFNPLEAWARDWGTTG